MTLSIKQVKLHHIQMRLKNPFRSSLGTIQDKEFFIVEMTDQDGCKGFGETVAFAAPWYTEETFKTTAHIIQDILIPLLKQYPLNHPDEAGRLFKAIKRNHMAKAGLEGAIWDLYAKQHGIPLTKALGGSRQQIDVGVSLGMEKNHKDLLQNIENYAAHGYKRFKIKIKPGHDLELLREIRVHFPDLPLMVDANSAYTLDDIAHLQKFDAFHLLMIEQPLADNDIADHAILQKRLDTPICLDESIHSYEDARLAIDLGSCEIINIKTGRVGGLTEAKRIHDLCQEKEIAVWCGGMLEAGVGRAHNIALSALSQFTFPGDISASSRYFDQDIIAPEVTVDQGTIQVPKKPGIGYEINYDILRQFTKSVVQFDM